MPKPTTEAVAPATTDSSATRPANHKDMRYAAQPSRLTRGFEKLDHSPGIAESLLGLAALAMAGGGGERAARLLGAAEALRRNASITRAPLELDLEREILERCAATIGEEALAGAREQGRALTAKEAAGLGLEALDEAAES